MIDEGKDRIMKKNIKTNKEIGLKDPLFIGNVINLRTGKKPCDNAQYTVITFI